MLIASSTPFDLIDHPEFKNFIAELNPIYQIPKSEDLKQIVLDSISKSMSNVSI